MSKLIELGKDSRENTISTLMIMWCRTIGLGQTMLPGLSSIQSFMMSRKNLMTPSLPISPGSNP